MTGLQGQQEDLSDNSQDLAMQARLQQQAFNHQLQRRQGHMSSYTKKLFEADSYQVRQHQKLHVRYFMMFM